MLVIIHYCKFFSIPLKKESSVLFNAKSGGLRIDDFNHLPKISLILARVAKPTTPVPLFNPKGTKISLAYFS